MWGRNEGPTYIGSRRVKRVRRIAEKGARRISDHIFQLIKKRADQLAQERADTLGIPKEELISSPEEMIDEFERAESRVANEMSRGRFFREHVEFVLDDVFGMKAVVEDQERERTIQWIDEHPHCSVVEVEHHRGHYNATNVVFRYSPPLERLLTQPLSPNALERLATRGLDPNSAMDELREFVLSGEDFLHIELIISNFQELIESEIGRSMHEDRIIAQRREQTYRGHLARNVSYLMEYIFACAISPKLQIDTIPIQVWIRYMPDYFDDILKELFNIPRFREIE